MKILRNPTNSELGITTTRYEVVRNEKGVLAVNFRYTPEDLKRYPDGFQTQFETINPGFSRGGHYHYTFRQMFGPDSAIESFYLLKGSFDLVVCDLAKTICEVYNIKEGVTYHCPGMIAHKAITTSQEQAEMVVAKPFNFEIINRTTMFDMEWTKDLKE